MRRWWRRSRDAEAVLSRRSFRDVFVIFLPALLITALGFIVALQFVKPAPPRHIVMATGTKEGAYFRIGMRYQEILARNGIELELRQTGGAYENVQLLADPGSGVEVAFLQGGAGSEGEFPGIETLGSVFYEPIWIFWRPRAPETIQEFRGARVAIGEPNSGTRNAIGYLLALNGTELDELTAVEIGGTAAEDALLAGDVDAACFVAISDAPYVTRLLVSDGVELMPFVRGEAYRRRFRFLSRVVLPRGVADLERDLPPDDISLIAMVANIGIRDSLHPALIGLLLDAAKEVHGDGGIFASPGQFPSAYNVVLPLNKDARRYLEKGPPFLQRYLPFWLAIAIDRLVVLLIPLVTLLYPLFKILPPTYRWRVRSRITRYYRALLGVEARLHDNPTPAEIERCRVFLDEIEERLSHVSVPLAYADMLYRLRLHLQFVRERLEDVAAGIDDRED
jgi:hypothetical protein